MVKENQADSPVERIEWRCFTDQEVWGLMLGIERSWRVLGVELEIGGRIPGRRPAGGPMYLIGTVRVRVQHSGSGKVRCPVCDAGDGVDSACEVRGARGSSIAGAVGGGSFAFYSAVRESGD